MKYLFIFIIGFIVGYYISSNQNKPIPQEQLVQSKLDQIDTASKIIRETERKLSTKKESFLLSKQKLSKFKSSISTERDTIVKDSVIVIVEDCSQKDSLIEYYQQTLSECSDILTAQDSLLVQYRVKDTLQQDVSKILIKENNNCKKKVRIFKKILYVTGIVIGIFVVKDRLKL